MHTAHGHGRCHYKQAGCTPGGSTLVVSRGPSEVLVLTGHFEMANLTGGKFTYFNQCPIRCSAPSATMYTSLLSSRQRSQKSQTHCLNAEAE